MIVIHQTINIWLFSGWDRPGNDVEDYSAILLLGIASTSCSVSFFFDLTLTLFTNLWIVHLLGRKTIGNYLEVFGILSTCRVLPVAHTEENVYWVVLWTQWWNSVEHLWKNLIISRRKLIFLSFILHSFFEQYNFQIPRLALI